MFELIYLLYERTFVEFFWDENAMKKRIDYLRDKFSKRFEVVSEKSGLDFDYYFNYCTQGAKQ